MPTRSPVEEQAVPERVAARVVTARRRPRRGLPLARGRLLWAGVCVVVAVALAGWLVWFSPVLVVRQVEVSGARPGQADRVRQQAQVPMGQPLARVDLPAVVDRVLATGPIARTTVSRRWPSTVRIEVTPRRLVMVAVNPEGEREVVDRDGVAYEPVGPVPDRLPTVSLVAVDASDRQAALAAAAGALDALPGALRHRVAQVSVEDRADVSLTLGQVRVHWGIGGDGHLKSRVLTTLLPQRSGDERGQRSRWDLGTALTIDVSAPRQPVVEEGSS